MHAQHDEVARNLDVAANELHVANDMCESMRRDHENMRSGRARLLEENAELLRAVDDADRGLQGLQNSISQENAVKQSLSDKVEQLQRDLSAYVHRAQYAEAELARAQDAVARTSAERGRMQELENDLTRVTTISESQYNEISMLEKTVTELQAMLRSHEAAAHDIEAVRTEITGCARYVFGGDNLSQEPQYVKWREMVGRAILGSDKLAVAKTRLLESTRLSDVPAMVANFCHALHILIHFVPPRSESYSAAAPLAAPPPLQQQIHKVSSPLRQFRCRKRSELVSLQLVCEFTGQVLLI